MKRMLSLAIIMSLLFGLFVPSASALNFDDGPVVAKPLVILMDFPDYKYTDFLEREDKDLILTHSDDYEPEFYQEMFFGDDTYKGPDDQDFTTMNKFFKLESRGKYSLKGDVFGWYTAKNNAAHYGDEQVNASWLVEEAADNIAKEANVDLSDYDVVDKYDYDNDGNFNEPDGIIDIVILVHAGKGEEWYSGGTLGVEAAIWPFQGNLSDYRDDKAPYEVEDTNGTTIKVEDFLVVEQDVPLGLACHEYGHYLDLPDLYGNEEPVQNWTVMAGGSYNGEIVGSRTVGYGAYCREELQEKHGGDWERKMVLDLEAISSEGLDVTLDAASSLDPNVDTVRINLPEKTTFIADPYSGEYAYFGGKEDESYHYMTTTIDLTNTSDAEPAVTSSVYSNTASLNNVSSNVELEFKTQYGIENEWDYAYVQVKEEGSEDWVAISGNITTSENPNAGNGEYLRNPGHAFTGSTNGEWVDGIFDLSSYAGKKIELRIGYGTDANTLGTGIFVDDIRIKVDGNEIFFDDSEGELSFEPDGFEKDDGVLRAEHYYLLEWRDHNGSDDGLRQSYYGSNKTSYDPGLLIWYVDRTYGTLDRLSQDAASNPGHVSVGIVDADQNPIIWKYPDSSKVNVDKVEYQMRDAAFSLRSGEEFFIQWAEVQTIDTDTSMMHPVFDDSRDYTNPDKPAAGLILENYGLKVMVTEENADRSQAKIHIMNVNNAKSLIPQALDISIDSVNILDDQADDVANLKSEEVTDIDILNDLVIVEASGDLGESGFIGYVAEDKDGIVEKGAELKLVDGKFMGSISDEILSANLDWKINFIVLEDSEGGMKAIYNSDLHSYGVDLSFGNISESTTYVTSLEMTASIEENTSLDLGLIGTLNDGSKAGEDNLSNVVWSTSDQSIAIVDNKGVVSGISQGEVTITAKLGGITVDFKINVVAGSTSKLKKINIDSSDMEVVEGDNLQLTITGTLEDGSTASSEMLNGTIWSSSDTSKATVDSNGLVTGVAEGNVTITANLNGISDTKNISVVKVGITNESESNNSFEDANGPISDNINVSADFEDSDNVDYYYFAVTSPGTIDITVTSDGSIGFNWLLYKESDQSNYVDYPSSGDNEKKGSYDAEAGRYFLKVYKYSGTNGTYTVNINGI